MKNWLSLIGAAALLLQGCALRHSGVSPRLTGPEVETVSVYRNQRTPDKLYVLARLPDGKDHAFLVDTGSSLTTVSAEVATTLGLEVRKRSGRLVGLGGSSIWRAATLGFLKVGGYQMNKVEVAVGVTGLPTHVGLVPLAGIIGNNIWSEFQVAIDYPANTLTLSRGQITLPSHAQPMFFNGQHPITRAKIQSADSPEHPVLLEIDTGARGLLLMGQPPATLSARASTGEEPILGIGTPDDLPPSRLLRETRRIPLDVIETGGMKIRRPIQAKWFKAEPDSRGQTARFSGLLGHDVLAGHTVYLDYQSRRFALAPSTAKPTPRPIHEWYLSQLKRSKDPKRHLEKVRTLLWLGRGDEARAALGRLTSKRKPDPTAIVLYARLQRRDGDPSAAHALLSKLPLAEIVAEQELSAWANTFWLNGQSDKAIEVTTEAVERWGEQPQVWVAHADALRAKGRIAEARHALHRANKIAENPDGHLLRRAWLAMEDGDRNAAMTHLRRLIDLFPSGGIAQLLYAMQASDSRSLELVRQDLERAQGRLHRGEGPLDFMAASWRIIGDSSRADTLMKTGLSRDCSRASSKHSRDNCEAWYRALTHTELAEARTRIDRALQIAPSRAEFLDTLAMVLEAQGHGSAAGQAALKAARLAPDDVYLLVQAARLSRPTASQ